MSKVKLTIDGREVEVPAGSTIYEAAQEAGVEIPTFCYDPELTKVGACRMCVVEVEKARVLVASCAAPAGDGMVVHTETERVIEARKNILRLIISNHPLECMTCQKTGDCRLQDYCYRYGIDRDEFEGEVKELEQDDTNPFILRDMNKCILCGKCIRKCEEINGATAIDFMNRGFLSNVGPAFDDPLEESPCVFCGLCVDACPVGALLPKESIGKGRPWQVETKEVICSYCGVGCSIELHIKDDEVVDASASENSPVNRGHLCTKGRFGWDFLNSEERLTMPMVKKDGVLVETSWDEALQLVADRLTEAQEKYGNQTLAGLSSAKVANEENYLFQKFMRALGTRNVDNCARLCHAPTLNGMEMAFGTAGMTNTIEEITGADTILLIGSNITETHPVVSYRVREAQNNGAKLVVVDPRETRLAIEADEFLQLRPGTDVAVLNGLVNLIIQEDLMDQQFIEEKTEGFEELKKSVEGYSPEYVEEISGVPAARLREAARLYGAAEKGSILYNMGLTSHANGTDNVLAVANLAMVTGNLGKESAGVNSLSGENNVQGACDMGALPEMLPGYQKIEENDTGLTAVEMMKAAADGKIKAMYVMGENPVLSEPRLEHVEEAMNNLDFLVVQDIFLSETAQYADVVLPAAAFAEKDGTYTNTERRVQLNRAALTPPGDALPDWEIITRLAKAKGMGWNYSSAEDVMKEIASRVEEYAGITYKRLEENRGLHWPCPDASHPGTPVLHQGKFARGRGKFHAVEYSKPVEETNTYYPLWLTTGRHIFHYHTSTMTGSSRGLGSHVPEEMVQVNPEDAGRLDISDGDTVEVASRRGKLKVRAELTSVVPSGMVFMTFHSNELAVNELTGDALDEKSKVPGLKVCAVNVRKSEQAH